MIDSGLANFREEINECFCVVEFVVAQLVRLVVPRKDVMEIVPALAESDYCHEFILTWSNVSEENAEKFNRVRAEMCRGLGKRSPFLRVLVIGTHAENMRRTVDEPGAMQAHVPSKQRATVECDMNWHTEQELEEDCGQNETDQRHEPNVIPVSP